MNISEICFFSSWTTMFSYKSRLTLKLQGVPKKWGLVDLRFQDQCTVSCTTRRWLVELGPYFMGVGTSDLGTSGWNFEPRKSIFTLQWASIVRLYLHKSCMQRWSRNFEWQITPIRSPDMKKPFQYCRKLKSRAFQNRWNFSDRSKNDWASATEVKKNDMINWINKLFSCTW